MRRNRRVRDRIEELLGPTAVAEIELWNDGPVDSLGDYGVPVDDREAALQDLSYMALPHDREAMWDSPH